MLKSHILALPSAKESSLFQHAPEKILNVSLHFSMPLKKFQQSELNLN